MPLGALAKERGAWKLTRTGVKVHSPRLALSLTAVWLALSLTAVWQVLTDAQRWVSNNFTDADKQEAINLFLGIFRPEQCRTDPGAGRC